MKASDIPKLPAEFDISKIPIKVGKVTNPNADINESQELVKWMRGDLDEIPQELRKVMGVMSERVVTFLMFILTRRLTCLEKLLEFTTAAEKELFKKDEIRDLSSGELELRYMRAMGLVENIMEFSRKFVVQAKESGGELSPEESKLLAKLKSLPPDKIKELDNLLDSILAGK